MVDHVLTFKCNNNCLSCINNTELISEKKDVPFSWVKRVIDRIEDDDHFGISGGEPTMSKDLFTVLEYVKKSRPELYVFFLSNGRMFSYQKFVKKFLKFAPKNLRIAVPLYGSTEKIHDTITRSKGSFNQAVDGIKNLLDAKVKVEIRPIISKLNYKDMENLAEFVTKELPMIDRFVFVNMKITGNAYLNFEKVGVRINEVWPFVEKAVRILKKKGINTRLYHFPLCTISKEFWNIAKGVTKAETWELTFVEECKKCVMRNDCPRIWKSYVKRFGDKEFKATESG
jgi:His-Xaa-Ser system radical SAM maturase HxsC